MKPISGSTIVDSNSEPTFRDPIIADRPYEASDHTVLTFRNTVLFSGVCAGTKALAQKAFVKDVLGHREICI